MWSRDYVIGELGALSRVVHASFEGDGVKALAAAGVSVHVRYERRPAAAVRAHEAELREVVDGLPLDVRRILHSAQRHALDGVVVGLHAWDPEHDASAVRHLHGLGLLRAMSTDAPPYCGPYRLESDLPPWPARELDLEEAVMDETDDLPEDGPGTVEAAARHGLARGGAAPGEAAAHPRGHAGARGWPQGRAGSSGMRSSRWTACWRPCPGGVGP